MTGYGEGSAGNTGGYTPIDAGVPRIIPFVPRAGETAGLNQPVADGDAKGIETSVPGSNGLDFVTSDVETLGASAEIEVDPGIEAMEALVEEDVSRPGFALRSVAKVVRPLQKAKGKFLEYWEEYKWPEVISTAGYYGMGWLGYKAAGDVTAGWTATGGETVGFWLPLIAKEYNDRRNNPDNDDSKARALRGSVRHVAVALGTTDLLVDLPLRPHITTEALRVAEFAPSYARAAVGFTIGKLAADVVFYTALHNMRKVDKKIATVWKARKASKNNTALDPEEAQT